MPLETGNTIASLNASWPLGSDPKSQGDDHLRLLKKVFKNDVVAIEGGDMTGSLTIGGDPEVTTALRLSPGGSAIFNNEARGRVDISNETGRAFIVTSPSAGVVPVTIRASADQAATVFRVENNAGGILASIAASAEIPDAHSLVTRNEGDKRYGPPVNKSNANLNDNPGSGIQRVFYWGSSSQPPSNAPSAGGGTVYTQGVSSTRASQIYVRGQGLPQAYVRVQDGTWTAWEQLTSVRAADIQRAYGGPQPKAIPKDADGLDAPRVIEALLDRIEALEAKITAVELQA